MGGLEERVDFASIDDPSGYRQVTEALGVKWKARVRHRDEGWRGIVWYAYQPEIPGWSGITIHVFREDGMHDVVSLRDVELETNEGESA